MDVPTLMRSYAAGEPDFRGVDLHGVNLTEAMPRGADCQASIQATVERALRNGPYPALKKLSCDYRDGVLILRGCLPSYYLKQVAQEVVAHQVKGVGRLDNQIQVVPPASH
jgi:hypothetical protein